MRRMLPLFLAVPALFFLSRVLPPAAAQSAPGDKVVGGPYIVNDSPRSATLMWIVQSGQVTLSGTPAQPGRTLPVLRAEKVTLSGLRPGTTNYYDAFGGDAGKGSFKTPPSGAAPFQFVVYGDNRTRPEVHRSVIQGVLRHASPDFVVQTGDMVADGWDTSLWPIFFDIERDLLRQCAIYPSPGNHERNSPNYYTFWNAKPYYSFNWGSAHFASINTDIGSAGSTQAERDAFWQEQTKWLEADLHEAQKADLRFVFGHHPPMTAVTSRQGDNPHMTALEPMFEKYRLSAAFFGHDHNYQHYLKNGVHYFITGGGGAPLYDVDTPPPGITQKVMSTENFLVVRVDGKKARFEALKPDGQSIDTAEIGQ